MASPSGRPLRILQVASHFPAWGGTEIHLINLTEQLAARGHHVLIAARPGRFVEAEAQKRGLLTVALTVKRQRDFRDAAKYLRLMRRERFDVVHAHWRHDYLVPPLMARIARVPAILFSHHSPYPLKPTELWSARRLNHRVIALSESVRRTLLAQNLPPEKVVTIHHGTDTEAFRRVTKAAGAIRAEWGVPDGAFLVGIAGRVSDEKGVDILLRALPPDVYCAVIGDGPQREAYQELAAERGIASRAIFAGFRSDVNDAINALDVLILASTWAEPCAAVVQQAMALAKPVIGTNIGGTPEMIADGETGLLIPPKNEAALSAAMRRLEADEAERGRMGAAGRERADALFNLTRMTDKNEALYEAILAERG